MPGASSDAGREVRLVALSRRHRGGLSDDAGAQAVEFALILPVLLLLVLGIINFGYVFGQQLSLNQAVREGARKAVVNKSADSASITTDVQNATGGLISPKTAVTVVSRIQDSATATGPFSATGVCDDYDRIGGQLEVVATYPASWLVPLPLSISAPGLRAEAVFRCEVI